jgi:hypothetical protein
MYLYIFEKGNDVLLKVEGRARQRTEAPSSELWTLALIRESSSSRCNESDARRLRGGGGELGNLKTYPMTYHYLHKNKLSYYLDVQLGSF